MLQHEQAINMTRFNESTMIDIDSMMNSYSTDTLSTDVIDESAFTSSKLIFTLNDDKMRYISDEIFDEIKTNEEKKRYLFETYPEITSDNFKFGNYFRFTLQDLYYIGKHGEILDCIDQNDQFHIPYEITKYTRNATKVFGYRYLIDLRFDDQFITENIKGTILESWNFKYTYCIIEDIDTISIEFPNGAMKSFELHTHVNDIFRFYKRSMEEQCTIHIVLTYTRGSDINSQLVPITWTHMNEGGTSLYSPIINTNPTIGATCEYIQYTGPLSEKDELIELLDKSYDHIEHGVSYQITDNTYGGHVNRRDECITTNVLYGGRNVDCT